MALPPATPPGPPHPTYPAPWPLPHVAPSTIETLMASIAQPGRTIDLASVDNQPLVSLTMPTTYPALPWTVTLPSVSTAAPSGVAPVLPAGVVEPRTMVLGSLLAQVLRVSWSVGGSGDSVDIDYPAQGGSFVVYATQLTVMSLRGASVVLPAGYYRPQGGAFVALNGGARSRAPLTTTVATPAFVELVPGDGFGNTPYIPIPRRAYAYRVIWDVEDPRRSSGQTISVWQENVATGQRENDRNNINNNASGPNLIGFTLWDAAWPGPSAMPLASWATAIRMFSTWGAGVQPGGYVQFLLDL